MFFKRIICIVLCSRSFCPTLYCCKLWMLYLWFNNCDFANKPIRSDGTVRKKWHPVVSIINVSTHKQHHFEFINKSSTSNNNRLHRDAGEICCVNLYHDAVARCCLTQHFLTSSKVMGRFSVPTLSLRFTSAVNPG